MKVLHVEDDLDWFERTILPELNVYCSSVDHETHYAGAIEKLSSNDYDYIIVDQSIPLDSSGSTPDITNGIRFADYVKKVSPGTPLLILTGQDRDEITEKYVEDQEQVVFWDGIPRGLVKVRAKSRLLAALQLIEMAAKELVAIDEIELDIPDNIELTKLQKRVIRIFAKHKEAIGAKIDILGGGLSSSAVLRVTLINSANQCFQYALAKIDKQSEVEKDASNYTNHINKLPVGCFPTLLGRYFAGCADVQGVFYQFANDYSVDYFSILRSNEADALNVLEKLIKILDSWEQAIIPNNRPLKEIRALLCSDDKFQKVKELLTDIDLDKLENKMIQVSQTVQHGDLHGKNILLTPIEKQPILIDYGDVKLAPSVLDIVTLELSPFFHSETAEYFKKDSVYFLKWFDDEFYINNSPFPSVACFLRKEKSKRAVLNNGYIATVYAYAIRQLTYKDTDHEAATSLVRAAVHKFNQ
ncbi:phosphotransferase [Photobacterium phosphoreum]|uniref:phosphotransferase n=1 Tax=Photobacterium phosphoreum TaxID=659 RepID=UPI001C631BA9|nr:phosphotransferase [Photobacterium phosphoreum]